ncbi:MAG TPA: cytochrome c [Candidatus Acidoferrales bacterium]|nr:cytochrome c [Candidatus Acidoferrales bacterium]
MNSLLRRVSQALGLAAAFLFALNISARADDSASLYKAKCAVCHAPDGSGNNVMGKQLGAKDLRSEEVQKKSDADLNGVVTNGMAPKMPAYKDKLTADQIKGLVVYIRELAKK